MTNQPDHGDDPTKVNVDSLFDVAFRARPRGVVALFKAYFDETRHSDGPYCVVGGFAGVQEQWEEFEADWLETLKPRSDLHMSSLRWNSKRDRLERLLNRMGPLPRKHLLIPIFGAVRRADYEEVVRGKVTNWTAAKSLSPYALCLQLCLKQIRWTLPDGNELFVYGERQTEWEPGVQVLSDAVFGAQKYEPRILGVAFLNKGQTPLFQPADYLLYHWAHHFEDENGYKAIATKSIRGDGQFFGELFEKRALELLVESMNEVAP